MFLPAFVLEAGVGVVLAGVGLGLLGTFLVGLIVFALQAELPYKKMLVVTGLISAVLVVMVVTPCMYCRVGSSWLAHPPALDCQFPILDGHLAWHLQHLGGHIPAVGRRCVRRRQLLPRRKAARP